MKLLFAVVLSLSSTIAHALKDGLPNVDAKNFVQKWFENQVDHFDYWDNRTFHQRYFENDEYFDKDSGPIFLYLCGDMRCSVTKDKIFPFMVGAKYKAKLLALEHRFYGASQPFNDTSLPNLKYLTSRQALADISLFLQSVNADKTDRKVVIIGNGYAGSLSAWFREKYPHMVVAAWSSAGMVYPQEDIPEFDLQVYQILAKNNLTEDCITKIGMLNMLIDQIYEEAQPEDIDHFMDTMGASRAIKQGDFGFFFADIFVKSIQYGNSTGLCKVIDDIKITPNFTDILEKLKKHADISKVVAGDYDRSVLNKTDIATSPKRCWTYQFCSEFGWFQTPYNQKDYELHMRPQSLEFNYWVDLCKDLFPGIQTITGVERSIQEYSFHHTKGTNTLVVNGSQNPWVVVTDQALESSQVNSITVIADCLTCSYQFDMKTPSPDDAEEISKARQEIMNWMQIILNNPSIQFIQ